MDIPQEAELRAHYARMADDEILNLALDIDSLTQNAQSVMADELNGRGLSSSDIAAYKSYAQKAAIFNSRLNAGVPIAHSVNGCGTCIFNRRDSHPDGSYTVTKWLRIFWIPVIPLQVLRVKRIAGSYQILDVRKPFGAKDNHNADCN